MGKEKELDFDCTHCEHYFSFVSGEKHCSQKEKELTELTPCLNFKMRQVQPNEFWGLITAMMFSFVQPQKQPVSEEKLAKAKELAKSAKVAMDRGEKYDIVEGTELYEDTELFNAYCSELTKIITIDNLNKETAKVAEMKKITSYVNGLPKK